VFCHGCPANLPDNAHISLDLLRRITQLPAAKVRHILGGIQSLGFHAELPAENDPHDLVRLRWKHWSPQLAAVCAAKDSANFTFVAEAIVKIITEGYCDEHAAEMIRKLNFAPLSSATSFSLEHCRAATIEGKTQD
jgi:hypothetical protein